MCVSTCCSFVNILIQRFKVSGESFLFWPTEIVQMELFSLWLIPFINLRFHSWFIDDSIVAENCTLCFTVCKLLHSVSLSPFPPDLHADMSRAMQSSNFVFMRSNQYIQNNRRIQAMFFVLKEQQQARVQKFHLK